MKQYEIRVKVPGTYYSVKVKAASKSEANNKSFSI